MSSIGPSLPEQGVGRLAGIGRLRMVEPDALDLGFEQGDSGYQLFLRVALQALGREPVRGISAHPGEIVVVHNRSRIGRALLAVNGGGE